MDITQLLQNRASNEVVACTPDTPMNEAVALLASRRIGALPVLDGEDVVGIFSERDVVYRLAEEGEACLTRPVSEVMTAPAISVDARTNLLEALSLMTRRRIRHLPVVDGTTMVGFVSIGDLVKTRLDEMQFEAEALRAYIQTA